MSDPTNETTVASAPVVQPAATPAPTPVVAPAAKPPLPSALHAHLAAVFHKLDEVKAFAVDGLKRLGVFIEHEAPIVAAAAGAVASVVPGIGPAAAAVAGVASKAAAVVSAINCTCGAVVHTGHGPAGCNVRGCSCKATTNPAPAS